MKFKKLDLKITSRASLSSPLSEKKKKKKYVIG